MRITYKLEKKDYFAFNLNQMKNFPKIRKSINIQRFVMPIMFSIFVFILAWRNNSNLKALIPIYGALILGWILLYPKILLNSMNKRLNKFLDADGNENLLSKRTIEINDEGIFEIIENEEDNKEEKIFAADKILKAEENEEYVYVFLNTQSVYLIPKHFFHNDNQKEEFLEKVEKLVIGE